MDILIVIALIVVALAIFLKKKSKDKIKTTGWRNNYSPGMSDTPIPQGDGWYFDFPTNPNSHVHYLQWFNPPTLVGAKLISIQFSVTGGGFIPQEFPDGRPALVSLLLQRKGDNWSADAKTRSYRWYSSEATELASGEYQLTIPLDVSNWGDVYNGQDASLFTETLSKIDNIGIVFGSAGGRGHGVYATQPSRFTLLNIKVS